MKTSEIVKITLSLLLGLTFQIHAMEQKLIDAIENGDTDLAEKIILKKNININFYDGSFTLLMYAITSNQPGIAKLLIDKGADPDILNIANNTALIYASRENQFDIVNVLINVGANLNIISLGGHSALSQAIDNRNAPIMNILLKAGASTAHLNSEQEYLMEKMKGTGKEEI